MTSATETPARTGLARPKRTLASRVKALLPRGLFGRSVLLLAAPLILSQIVGTWVFYDRFWVTIMRRNATAATSDIALVVVGRHAFTRDDEPRFLALVDGTTGFHTIVLPKGAPLAARVDASGSRVGRYLAAALAERSLGAFSIDGAAWPTRCWSASTTATTCCRSPCHATGSIPRWSSWC